MTKRKTKKAVKVKDIKIQPEVSVSEPVVSAPVEKPKVNPNNPKLVGVSKGLKHPSITDLRPAHTYKQYEALIEAYKISNPAKYEGKKSELASKLAKLK